MEKLAEEQRLAEEAWQIVLPQLIASAKAKMNGEWRDGEVYIEVEEVQGSTQPDSNAVLMDSSSSDPPTRKKRAPTRKKRSVGQESGIDAEEEADITTDDTTEADAEQESNTIQRTDDVSSSDIAQWRMDATTPLRRRLEYLYAMRKKGWDYRTIIREGKFTQQESTLRRYLYTYKKGQA